MFVCKVCGYSMVKVENIKKKQYLFLIEIKFDGKVELLNETLINIFRNIIPLIKKIKCDIITFIYNIKKDQKERSKLTKQFYKNGHRER